MLSCLENDKINIKILSLELGTNVHTNKKIVPWDFGWILNVVKIELQMLIKNVFKCLVKIKVRKNSWGVLFYIFKSK